MNNTSSTQLNPFALLLTSESPTLRIAYKNAEVKEIKENKPGVTNIAKKANPAKVTKKTVVKETVKEPLPLFNDYRIKGKDNDPL